MWAFRQGRIDSLLVVITAVWSLPVADVRSDDFTIPESKLLDDEFASTRWGGEVVRSDVAGDGVQFAFSGLGDSSTGVKDDYPVDTVYGQVLPSHGNGDFSNFSGYSLWIENLDDQPVLLSVFINTGFTGPSGVPPNTPANDTFWQSPWKETLPGQTRILRLDFDEAIPWGIEDNPDPHTQGTDGKPTAINAYDRAEVSSIGFQIVGPDNPEATIVVFSVPDEPQLAPADFDRDGDVDLDDFSHFHGCVTGPEMGPPSEGCEDADLSTDDDVDIADFALLQLCLRGSGILADPACAD